MLNRFFTGFFPLVMAVVCLAGAFRSTPAELKTTSSAPETPSSIAQETKSAQSYIGSNACFTCHRAQGSSWSETKHAKAFEHLPEKYRADSSCLTCHVTALGEAGGYALGMTADEAEPFQNVGCESCHGPGADHEAAVQRWTLAEPADEERLLKEMKAAIIKTPPDSLCASCHKTQMHQTHPPYDGQPLKHLIAPHSNNDSGQKTTAAAESLPPSPHNYSVKTCGSCHYVQYKRWRVETHADLSLGLPAKYENDESCLGCHWKPGESSDWYAATSDPKAAANRLGVGCESCHGSALKHVLYNKQNMSGQVLTAEKVQASRELIRNEKPASACLQCHIREGHKPHPEFEKPDVTNTK